jgi:hypothetical protein
VRELKLSRILDTLPEVVLARQQKMPHQDLLLLTLQDEVVRRDSQAATLRAQNGHLDSFAQLENWDDTAKVTFDRALLNELASLRFLESHHHALIVGPVGVGKSFLAHALGHVACRRGHSVLALAADKALKAPRASPTTGGPGCGSCSPSSRSRRCLDQMDARRAVTPTRSERTPRRLHDRHLNRG